MENLLEIGKIVNTHGLRGEVKVVPWTDSAEDFEYISSVYIKIKNEYKKLTISGVKYQKNNVILKFKEYNDINEILPFKNCVLYAERDELGELPEGVYYIVKREGKKNLLLPVIDEVVKNVDIKGGKVIVNIMEGLDDEV